MGSIAPHQNGQERPGSVCLVLKHAAKYRALWGGGAPAWGARTRASLSRRVECRLGTGKGCVGVRMNRQIGSAVQQ